MINMIVAISQNNQIGCQNALPWHLPEDLKYFKQRTNGHIVIMGRKTYESIGRPLPNRTNVVLTKDISFQAPEVIVLHSLEEALAFCKSQNALDKEIFIIGGGEIYSLFLPYVERLYITLVDKIIEGDTSFPIYQNDFELVEVIPSKETSPDGITYRFTIWNRKK